MTYLRWAEGDADEIAPSLFAKPGRRASPEAAPGEDAPGERPAPGGATASPAPRPS